MRVLKLFVQKGIEQHGVKIFRDGGPILFRCRIHLFDRHDSIDDIEGVEGFRRTAHPVGFFCRSGGTYLCVCIAHVGVLQLFRIRLLIDIEHKISIGNLCPEQAQVYCRDGLQHAHSAGAVPEAVMALQGNPAVVIVDTQQVTAAGFEIHGHAGIGNIRPDKGAGPCIWFQITPEKSLMNGYLIGGKALHRDIHGFLKDLGTYGFFQ